MRKIVLIIMLFSSALTCAAEFDQMYYGKYSWGPEVDTFTLCSGKKSYWVSFAWAGMEMHTFYKNHQKESYQPMYLAFRGHLLDEFVDGFAEQYDGLIRISEVKNYSFELPESCK